MDWSKVHSLTSLDSMRYKPSVLKSDSNSLSLLTMKKHIPNIGMKCL